MHAGLFLFKKLGIYLEMNSKFRLGFCLSLHSGLSHLKLHSDVFSMNR